MKPQVWVTVLCRACGNPHTRTTYEIARGRGKYCNLKCAAAGRRMDAAVVDKPYHESDEAPDEPLVRRPKKKKTGVVSKDDLMNAFWGKKK